MKRLLILAAVLLPCVATGQITPKPMVFVVMDTSGSMSYVQEDTNEAACTTGATKDPTFTYSMSRDMIAKEVLTGSYTDFWCKDVPRPAGRYDEGYPIKWLVPQYTIQNDDGILDDNAEFQKFALLTFDTMLESATDDTGQYSLGPNGQAVPGVGLTNIGAQNDLASFGKLVIPDRSDTIDSMALTNAAVQTNVLNAIPFGGTPIAPALEDTLWLINNHTSLTKETVANPGGDPFAACRQKDVLLITDGLPNMGEAQLGYGTSAQAAEALLTAGYKTHVVGFALTDLTVSKIHEIAAAGGTTQAHIVQDTAQLTSSLSAILGKLTPGKRSFTRPVFTNITGSNVDLQYQITTAFSSAPTTDLDTAGFFDVTAYSCEELCVDAAGGAGPCRVDDVRKSINAAGSTLRDIRFVKNGALQPFTETNTELTAALLGMPTTGTFTDITQNPISSGGFKKYDTSLKLDLANNQAQFRRSLIKLVRGDTNTRRETEIFAGIKHSTPVIQENLSGITFQDAAFIAYQNQQATRPTVGYTMTLDGFVHAIHLSRPQTGSAYTWLQEMWAIAPETVLPNMFKTHMKTQEVGDGLGRLKDIRLRRTAQTLTLAQETKLWRSVLVMPFGRGGRGLFALDVTDPTNPFVRWEISNTKHCYLDGDDPTTAVYVCRTPADGDQHDFSKVGKVRGQPLIGSVFVKNTVTNSNEELAAVLFSCGSGVEAEAESGRCFQVVRLDTGIKLKEFENGTSSVSGNSGASDAVADNLGFDIVGTPIAHSLFLGNFITRAFVGDGGGQMWRIDTSSNDPADWKMTHFFDAYYDNAQLTLADVKRAALREKPALAAIPQRGKVALVFSTGDPDTNDALDEVLVYSLQEQIALDGTVTSVTNWKRQLSYRENLTGAPIIFGSDAYWTSYQFDENDPCELGTGRIWGVHYTDSVPNGTGPVGTIDVDGDLTTLDPGEYVELPGVTPRGLSIVARPSCVGNSGVEAAAGSGSTTADGGSNSPLKAAKAGKLELVVQTDNPANSSQSAQPGVSGTLSTGLQHKALKKPTPRVVIISWGRVEEL